MDSPEAQSFIGDKDAGKEAVKKYDSGTAQAPVRDFK